MKKKNSIDFSSKVIKVLQQTTNLASQQNKAKNNIEEGKN